MKNTANNNIGNADKDGIVGSFVDFIGLILWEKSSSSLRLYYVSRGSAAEENRIENEYGLVFLCCDCDKIWGRARCLCLHPEEEGR